MLQIIEKNKCRYYNMISFRNHHFDTFRTIDQTFITIDQKIAKK